MECALYGGAAGDRPRLSLTRGPEMLYGAIVLAVAAVMAGMFGFGGLISTGSWVARVLFFLFVVLLLVTLIAAML